MFIIILTLSLITQAMAFSTFDTNCTVPTTINNFVSAPNTRGTLQILWSCFFTLLASTWTVLHLNVPEYKRKPEKMLSWSKVKWWIGRMKSPVTWFFITLLAPEVTLGKYWDDFEKARNIYHDEKYKKIWESIGWELTHVMVANMGGFAVSDKKEDVGHTSQAGGLPEASRSKSRKIDGKNPTNELETTPHEPLIQQTVSDREIGQDLQTRSEQGEDATLPDSSQEPRTQHQATSLECHHSTNTCKADTKIQFSQERLSQNRLQSAVSTPENHDVEAQRERKSDKYEDSRTVNAKDILGLLQEGQIEIPKIPVEELDDRDKSDPFMRVIAVGQILWVFLQIVARAARGLAVTQLEVAVLAFSGCAVGMYALNWNKPKGVGLPYILYSPNSKEEINAILEPKPQDTTPDEDGKGIIVDILTSFLHTPKDENRIRNRFSGQASTHMTDWVIVIGSFFFGCLHLVAWNFHFPTEIERILWRVAAAYCTIRVPLFVLLSVLIVLPLDRLSNIVDELHNDLSLTSEAESISHQQDPTNGSADANSGQVLHVSVGPDHGNEETVMNAEEQVHNQSNAGISNERDQAETQMLAEPKTSPGKIIKWCKFFILSATFVILGLGGMAILFILFLAYILARLYIFVEMFRALCHLPPDAYVGTWAANLPGLT